MNLQELLAASLKNIFFAVIALALALPILLSLPGVSKYVVNMLGIFGFGE